MKQLLTLLSLALYLTSCGDPERNNPDDPHGINYMGNNSDAVLSSSSSSLVAQSSSSVKVSSSSTPTQSGIIYDTPVLYHDDNYQTIKIGEQIWFQRNLNYFIEGSKCYDDETANCAKYGRLYDWATAKTVCPEGWHLPSNAEWTTLTNFVGSSTAGKKLKAKNDWNNNGNGTDEFGFSALPGGGGYLDGSFCCVGYDSNWWTSTGNNEQAYAYYWNMHSNDNYADWKGGVNGNLFSVRCVKD